MLDEIWKSVPYYEGYEVSNYGRVRSLDRTVIGKNGKSMHIEAKYLTQHDNGHGYLFVSLWKNNKGKREYVHRLVALAFLENPNNYPCVNHRDEDKQNNYYLNLEWCTYEYNNNYGTCRQRMVETMRKKGFYDNFAERMKKYNPNKGQYKGKDNAYAKKVICDGKIFGCLKECAEFYGINYGTFRNYMSSLDRMPDRFKNLGLAYLN